MQLLLKDKGNEAALGGKAKGKAYDDKKAQAKALSDAGVSNAAIARQLGADRKLLLNGLKMDSNDTCGNSQYQINTRRGDSIKPFVLKPRTKRDLSY